MASILAGSGGKLSKIKRLVLESVVLMIADWQIIINNNIFYYSSCNRRQISLFVAARWSIRPL
jgi:hypothetical protein